MIKSVICVVAAVIFILINTMVLFLHENVSLAENDDNSYTVYYEKWIGTVVFMSTIIASLFAIYFALNLFITFSLIVLSIECILSLIYCLVRYKSISVYDNNIKVERLFRKDINITFNNIIKVIYVPNAKLIVRYKNKQAFDLSFNSVNFKRFYDDLIVNDVKFKTTSVPYDQDHVYIQRYNMTILFPNKMFREYYESNRFLRNSKYLFSARNLEDKEFIEGYVKESKKDDEDFISLIKNDLQINEFKAVDVDKKTINGFDFTIIKSLDEKDNSKARLSYIYKDDGSFLILYCDYYLENEENFAKKMEKSIKRSEYSEGQGTAVRV